MKRVILFGATGNLGKEIANELIRREYDVTVVIRNQNKTNLFSGLKLKYIIKDVCVQDNIKGIFENQDIAVSALGKSVSPNDHSKSTFREVDFIANSNLLAEAKTSGIKKFVYISAFHSERYQHLEYFKVHHEFSELLKNSGIDFAIIKPPAIFSAYKDAIILAQKGQLVNIGSGENKTNPIYEGDLAKITVDAITKHNCIIEAGGKLIYTRGKINEIIQMHCNQNTKVKSMPIWIVKLILPIMRLFNKNMYHKFSFFAEVFQHDTIAPALGEMSFEDYIKLKTK